MAQRAIHWRTLRNRASAKFFRGLARITELREEFVGALASSNAVTEVRAEFAMNVRALVSTQLRARHDSINEQDNVARKRR